MPTTTDALGKAPYDPWRHTNASCRDLCKSVCDSSAHGGELRINENAVLVDFVDEHSLSIKNLLIAIPSTFHNARLKTDAGEIPLFDLNGAE